MKSHSKSLLLALLISIVYIGAYGQGATTSALRGQVLDDRGTPIPYATVVAVHEPSGTSYGTTTAGDGTYTITGMRVGGPYQVTMSFVGYTPMSYKDIDLNLGETYVLNGVLKESATELEAVVVSAGLKNPIMNSDRTGAQTNISRRTITSIPTISRSITDLSRLTPQSQGNSFGGRDGRFNSITVDGAAFNNNFGLSSNPLPGGEAQPISLDAIDQVTVNIAPFDVRLSQFTGASINAVTRSGDNTYKGSVYSYMRPKSFTGSTVDGKDVAGANDRSSTNYGVSLGGPIIKNKLFFFVNGELETVKIPGVDWKPSTDGQSNADLMISRTRESDMIRVRDHLISTYGYDPGKYKDFDPFKNQNHKILARIDWNINANHKFTFRYNDVVGTSDQQTNANSGPLSLRGSNRIGPQSMAFSNSFYGFKNTVRSITGEVNSIFTPSISNKFLTSYTFIQDTRTSPSSLFPFVDIWQNNDSYISFGYELFTYNNDVTNKTFSIVNNTTINLNQHTITAGVSFDRLFFRNSYIREGTSYYRYASVDDFINQANPIGFGITYGYNGNDAPGAEVTFGLGALYAQDEWKMASNLKITLGLRVERPFFFDELTDNPAISALTFANNYKLDVGSWPDAKLLYSPRLGFNWDVKGDRSLQVRGGSGIFTGLLPFVWFTNQPTNSGVIQSPEIGWAAGNPNLNGLQFHPDFKKFIADNPTLFPPTPGALPNNAALVEVSKDFKMPQVWRSNLAVDVELPYNMVFTGEALFGKDINAVQQVNVNEGSMDGTMTGADNRPYFTTNAARKVVSNIGSATILQNTGKGYQYSLTAQLTKNFSNGLSGMFAYTYTMAKDITANPGSAAYSAYSSNVAVGSLNDPGLSYSNFATPHQLVGYASYRIEYLKMFATTITLSYRGYQTGRYSYTYSNDYNNDGISSDLMYIPKDPSEITFTDYTYDPDGATGPLPATTMTAAQQSDAFFEYVNSNDYLKNHKGEYAERYGEVRPFVHRFDIKILQDIFSTFGTTRKYTLQLSIDLLNVGNMINDNWGTTSYHPLSSYDNVRLLTRSNAATNASPTVRLNANTIDDFKAKTTLTKTLSTSNTWGAMFGLRLIF